MVLEIFCIGPGRAIHTRSYTIKIAMLDYMHPGVIKVAFGSVKINEYNSKAMNTKLQFVNLLLYQGCRKRTH